MYFGGSTAWLSRNKSGFYSTELNSQAMRSNLVHDIEPGPITHDTKKEKDIFLAPLQSYFKAKMRT